jgi:hypothetical protein
MMIQQLDLPTPEGELSRNYQQSQSHQPQGLCRRRGGVYVFSMHGMGNSDNGSLSLSLHCQWCLIYVLASQWYTAHLPGYQLVLEYVVFEIMSYLYYTCVDTYHLVRTYACTRVPWYGIAHSHSLTLAHSLTHSLTHSLSLTYSLTDFTHSHSRSHSLTLTLSHTGLTHTQHSLTHEHIDRQAKNTLVLFMIPASSARFGP